MTPRPVCLGILLVLALCFAGCTVPASPVTPEKTPGISDHPVLSNPVVTTTAIPLLFTDADWQLANGCGWTADNISGTAALLRDNCEVRQLLLDGWEITGIGYDMNFPGSRCRLSTHPDAGSSCDWCLDAGPTLTLRYGEIMTTEFLVNVKEGTVTRFRTDLPEGTGSASMGDKDIVRFRNGTVLYTFRTC